MKSSRLNIIARAGAIAHVQQLMIGLGDPKTDAVAFERQILTPTPIHLSISYLTIEDIQSPAAPGFWVDEEQNRFLAACFSVKVSLQLLRVFGAHFCD